MIRKSNCFCYIFLLGFVATISISCKNSNAKEQLAKNIVSENVDSIIVPYDDSDDFRVCIIKLIDENISDDASYNALFDFQMKQANKWHSIFSDSIFTTIGEVEFVDYNNDGQKDILIQHDSSARSNFTYYLYLFDKHRTKIRKIKNFETILNPVYDIKNQTISNYVLSGKNWSSFYEIKGDSVLDYGIVIEDQQSEDVSDYYLLYNKAIDSIKILRENR